MRNTGLKLLQINESGDRDSALKSINSGKLFDISYRPSTGALKGLWFRFRYGHVVQYQGTRSVTDQFRIIINYDFSLL